MIGLGHWLLDFVVPTLVMYLVAGFVLGELNNGSSDGFQRSGSIMVASGVLLWGLGKTASETVRTSVSYLSYGRLGPLNFLIWVISSTVILLSQFVTLIVGTLTWGYGDLFYCWFHGKGWTTC